jgi:hypothetical protein
MALPLGAAGEEAALKGTTPANWRTHMAFAEAK